MPIQPSWDSLADQLRAMNSRLQDLENARRSFSTRISSSQGTITFGGTSGQPLSTWVAGGPDIYSMPIANGTILVVASADVTIQGEDVPVTAYCSWSIRKTGSSVAEDVVPDLSRSLVTVWDDNMGTVRSSASFAFLHQGLDEGNYDLTSQFRCYASTNPTGAVATIGARNLIAIPL